MHEVTQGLGLAGARTLPHGHTPTGPQAPAPASLRPVGPRLQRPLGASHPLASRPRAPQVLRQPRRHLAEARQPVCLGKRGKRGFWGWRGSAGPARSTAGRLPGAPPYPGSCRPKATGPARAGQRAPALRQPGLIPSARPRCRGGRARPPSPPSDWAPRTGKPGSSGSHPTPPSASWPPQGAPLGLLHSP